MTNLNKWVFIEELKINVALEHFWRCVDILITKPFVLNKNIGGCDLYIFETSSVDKVQEELECYIQKLLKYNPIDYQKLKTIIENNSSIKKIAKSEIANLYSTGQSCINLLKVVFPRNGEFRLDIFHLIFYDFTKNRVTFVKPYKTSKKPNLLIDTGYLIRYYQGKLGLSVEDHNQALSLNFLKSVLFTKFCSWMKSDLKTDQIHSLTLVEADEYVVLYNELKKKYFSMIKEIWTECTDIDKFAHEDIAIATYLILLWGKKEQSFVDLGCGNGLLVFILNNEGHKGVGIDVCARKIWEKYPPHTILKEMTIIPSDKMLFPDADWIIGNHSDELTPWIPIIALRSSFKTNFFLLPCCAYEFDGRKYSRNNVSKSQYFSYMDFVEEICRTCGFITFKDRLRIPSTKRICFISFGRTYIESEVMSVEKELVKLMNRQTKLDSDINGRWINCFKPRESKQKVRNCTQLNVNLLEDIINSVSKLLLKDTTECWNEGAPIKLSSIVDSIPINLLQQLKHECGGLQTVLKNHHHIFLLEHGTVKFRKPVARKISKENWKKKNCWFYKNHPDSCPLSDEICSYKHEEI